MSKSARKVIGITLGDPAGIGPEVTAKALAKRALRKEVQFVVIADQSSLQRYFPQSSSNVEFCVFEPLSRIDYKPGKPTALSGALAFEFLRKSVELLKQKKINAVVTAPLSKESVCRFEPGFCGHTEYFAHTFKVKKFDMLFVADEIKTVIATRHIPLHDVPRAITPEKIFETIVLLNETLRQQFKISHPRIAVCGLNPHAGEGGVLGSEEIMVITPAIRKAQSKGIKVLGPFAGDTMFVPHRRQNFDAIVSMYHDQGLIAMKTLYSREVVNLTIGLPFVRTSPAHGTAFDIAGKNKADASSMIAAILLAVKLA